MVTSAHVRGVDMHIRIFTTIVTVGIVVLETFTEDVSMVVIGLEVLLFV